MSSKDKPHTRLVIKWGGTQRLTQLQQKRPLRNIYYCIYEHHPSTNELPGLKQCQPFFIAVVLKNVFLYGGQKVIPNEFSSLPLTYPSLTEKPINKKKHHIDFLQTGAAALPCLSQ